MGAALPGPSTAPSGPPLAVRDSLAEAFAPRHGGAMSSTDGGRFTLRLLDFTTAAARYGVELSSAAARWSATASASASDGNIDFSAWQAEGVEGERAPPDWLLHYTRAALRDAWRGHAELGWPRRIHRWRSQPSASRSAGDP